MLFDVQTFVFDLFTYFSFQFSPVGTFFCFFFITKLKYRSDKCKYLIVTYL